MAKIYLKQGVAAGTNGNLMVSLDIDPLRIPNQKGDKFFVPAQDMFAFGGTPAPIIDEDGKAVLDDQGNPMYRQVGNRFPAGRVVDGKITEIVELYIGQVVKVDVHNQIAFPGVLSDALRQGGAKFKDAICGIVLEIKDQKEVEDRMWDRAKNRWMRDPETNQFVVRKNTALKFEPVNSNLSKDEVKKFNEKLVEFYTTTPGYKELIEVRE